MVEIPNGAQLIVETGPGIYTVEWVPRSDLYVCGVYGADAASPIRLDSNNRIATYTAQSPQTFGTMVQLLDGSTTFSPSFDPPGTGDDQNDYFDYGYRIGDADNEVKVTFHKGLPPPPTPSPPATLTGLTVRFRTGGAPGDDKDNDTGVTVSVNQGGVLLARYRQIRPDSGEVVTPGGDQDHQQTQSFGLNSDIPEKMKLFNSSVVNDGTNSCYVEISIETVGHDSWSFYWGLIPEWNGVAGTETQWPYYWTLASYGSSGSVASATLNLQAPGSRGFKPITHPPRIRIREGAGPRTT